MCVGVSTKAGQKTASFWCGDWRFVAFHWICGSIPSGVIRGAQMQCSGKVLSLTAAVCVLVFFHVSSFPFVFNDP